MRHLLPSLLLAGCVAKDGASGSTSPLSVEIPTTDDAAAFCADAGTTVPVRVRLNVDHYEARSSWPSLSVTLSSGTWLGDGDSTFTLEEMAQTTLDLGFHPDPSAREVSVTASLTIEGTPYSASTSVLLCPAVLAEPLGLAADSMSVDSGGIAALTATVRSATGGTPSPGTSVRFEADVPSGVTAVFDHDSAPVDATTGQATANLLLDGPELTTWTTVTVTATAEPPTWEGCPRGERTSGTVTLQLLPPEADDGDTGDTDGPDSSGG